MSTNQETTKIYLKVNLAEMAYTCNISWCTQQRAIQLAMDRGISLQIIHKEEESGGHESARISIRLQFKHQSHNNSRKECIW